MTPAERAELERYFPKTDDPEVRERQRLIVQMLLKRDPEFRQMLIDEAYQAEVEAGREEGRIQMHERLYERRLGRPLSEGERAVLRERWARLGADRLGDVVLDSSAEALAAWLADPAAR